ncbi:integration host factor subunit alpha [Aurantimonas sp. A2-1-M11]|uniref:integration host factor subunit alpha n=1 Tax=Aurantimonas sp. A2-1-M11 TaxID=3113712 RepID=UPI002F935928
MGDRTLTRADLSEAVFRKIGLSRTESAQLVEMVLDEMCSTIASGESVKISSFGSFLVREKNERIGRNPKTGEEVPILPRRVAVFKPSNVLKDRIVEAHVGRQAGSTASDTELDADKEPAGMLSAAAE